MSQPWVYMYSPFRSPALQGGSLPSKLPEKPIENRLANPGPQAGVIHLRIQVPNKKSEGGRNRVKFFTSTDFLLQVFGLMTRAVLHTNLSLSPSLLCFDNHPHPLIPVGPGALMLVSCFSGFGDGQLSPFLVSLGSGKDTVKNLRSYLGKNKFIEERTERVPQERGGPN